MGPRLIRGSDGPGLAPPGPARRGGRDSPALRRRGYPRRLGGARGYGRRTGRSCGGEIGLDFYRNLSPPDVQRDAFARQLELAARVRKPVIVHDREAHDDITTALVDHAPRVPGVPGILHAFSGDAAMATALAAAGYLISFALPVSFPKNVGPRAAAAAIPATNLLVETDSPYLGLAPDQRNEPTTVLRTAAMLARLREESVETVTTAAGRALAGIQGQAS